MYVIRKTTRLGFAPIKSGLTLIELLLVISIVATLSTISTVFFTRFMTQNAVANTQDRMIGQLRKAQFYSMMGKQNSSWGVNFSSNTITLYKGSTFGSDPSFDEKFNVNPSVSVTSSTGILDWNFTRVTGLASNTPVTITISGGNTIKIVTVNSQGVISR